MLSDVREISGLVALVSTTLIGTTILLLKVAWRGMTNSYFKLGPVEKREVGRFVGWITLFFQIVLSVMVVVGVYNPQLVQGATILTMLLLEAAVLIISLGYWIVKKIRKIETRPTKKLDELSLFYALSFSLFGWAIFYDIFALFGISAAMLDIKITPNWLDSYNWGRWFMLNGITLFCYSLPVLGYAQWKANWPPKSDSNQTGV